MNSSTNNSVTEDYNFMGMIETVNSLLNSSDTISNELNIDTDNFADILNSHLIDNTKLDNSNCNKKNCLEEFDKVCSDFGIHNDKGDCHMDDISYDILDLDTLAYVTVNSKRNNTTKFDECEINNFLYDHNYCTTKESIQTCAEEFDTSKLEHFYKNEEKSFNEVDNFNNTDYSVGEVDESPKEYNLQETNLESIDVEIITDNFVDNISIYTISDDESDDIISISSDSSDDSNSCGYHSSDFEFIDEEEAKKGGLIINYNLKTINNEKVKTIDISKEFSSQNLFLDDFNVPIENIEHELPQEIKYISMFERNIPYPVRSMENKSIYTNNCSMLADYQDVGFNMSLYGCEKVKKHVVDEANETKNKILFMYPSENGHIHI